MFREQMESVGDRQEIAFFDLETTIPFRAGQGFALLEFGAILVCPRKLVELHSYSTLVRPADLFSVSVASVRCNGITRDAVASAPTFREIADKVYDILHGRVWAGHNIVRFDCVRIREAFAEIGRPAPEPKGTIDSLALLTQRFGRRAGDMKMATLATYFGLGQQTHRSLDDVRMNLEVLKYCATVLFLEASLPDIFTENSWVSPNATTRSRSNGKTRPEGTSIKMRTSPNLNSVCNEVSSPTYARTGAEVANLVESDISQPSAFNMGTLIDQMKVETGQQESSMEERPVPESTETYSAEAEGCSGYAGFLEPDEVSIPSITTSLAPSFRGSQRIQILHKNVCLQLCCMDLRVRFGVSAKFLDHAGRQKPQSPPPTNQPTNQPNTKSAVMRFSVATAAAALAATAQARISGIAVPETIRPGDSVHVKLLSEGYIQSVDDIAIAFGYSNGEGYPGTLSNTLQSSYLGPDQSNQGLKNISKVLTFPTDVPKGQGVVSAGLFSLYGKSKSTTIVNFNVTVTFGDETSTVYKASQY